MISLLKRFIRFVLPGCLAILWGAGIASADIDSNLEAWWKMDEGAGTTVADSSGNNNTANFDGAPTWTSGKKNSALSFDGSDDNLTTTTNYNNPNPFTISVWFKSTGAWRKMVGFEVAQSGTWAFAYDRMIYLDGDNLVRFMIFDGGEKYATSPATYADGEWHLAVGTSDGSNIKLYMDGVLVATTAAGNAQNFGGYWRIASYKCNIARCGDGYFAGEIDEVRIYSRALTATDVSELYVETKVHTISNATLVDYKVN